MARQKNTENLVAINGQVTPGTRKALESRRYNPQTQEIATFGAVVREVVEAGLKALNVTVVEPSATPDAPAVDAPVEVKPSPKTR